MPKRKRSTFKRKTRKRLYRRRKVRGIKPMVARMISRAEETKFGYYAPATTTILSGVPTMALLFGNMFVGPSILQRIGQKITLTSLRIRLAVEANPVNPCRFRFLVVRDKNANGSLPPSAVDPLMDKTVTSGWLSDFDPATVSQRYQVIWDRTMSLQVAGGSTNLPAKHYVKLSSFKKRPIIYNGNNSGTIGDINKGAIVFFAFTDATANGPTYTLELSAKYKDS